MATTLENPVIPDEPPAIDPKEEAPPGTEEAYKAIAKKFRENFPGAAQAKEPAKELGKADAQAGKEVSKATDPGGKSSNAQGTSGGNASQSKGTVEPGKDSGTVRQESTVQPGGIEEVQEPPANQPITRDHFKKLAQSKEAYKAETERLKKLADETAQRAKQLEDDLAKTKAALPPNLEEVQKAIADASRIVEENKRLTAEIETVNLERSPKFKSWWAAETTKHVKIAQQHVPADQREAIGKLLMQPASAERDTAISEIVEKLPAIGQRLVTGALEAMEGLRLQREEALSKGSERWKELQAHEKAEQEKAAQAQAKKMQDLTAEALKQAQTFSAFQKTGDAQHDAEVPQREAFIRKAMSGQLDMDIMLRMPAISVEYLHLTEKVIPGLKAEIAKQSELIKQLQGASPAPSDGSAGKPGANPKREEAAKTGTSFAERVLSEYSGRR